MKLPNAAKARVERGKITEYLLCLEHPDGGSKAVFFKRFGFKIEKWQVFAKSLLDHGANNSVFKAVESSHGTRYTVAGRLATPDGRDPEVRTVWIIERGRQTPRLITAYPSKETR